MRAAAAKGGLYGNDAAEAMYPYTRTDATGETLDGSKHNYTITFPAGQLPPVNAFWSVTMYDGKSQLLIKNPINRYLINSPMLPDMKKNADGSLTLYIQKDSPGADKESNWLPAPNDTDLSRLASLLAEGDTALNPATGRRHMEAAGHRSVEIKLNIGCSYRRFEFHKSRQQSRSFARWNQSLRYSPQLKPALLRLSAMISQGFI